MKKTFFYFACLILIFVNTASAIDFSGSYVLQTETGAVTLTLQKDAAHAYRGKLAANGNAFDLRGIAQSGWLSGTVGDDPETMVFQAELKGNYLTLTMAETDDNNNPIPGTAQTLVFQRQAAVKTGAASKKIANDNTQVIINDVTLSKHQISEMEKTYGRQPRPGKYWYDSKSGLYGVLGYPAYGFMLAGQNFGGLARDASKGDTGVLVNGRELPQSEWAVWSYMLGYWIQPGAYWLDHNGNAGYEGNPAPVVNLYAAARQNTYSGRGASGDNFWSTRFSAGNFDSGNQRGYVSVPGYGPVGYGF
ncbi:MAG: hypothetical protein JSV83_10800 [Desulfobacterales bacterium]|nr:MAG: hypothetical protein JSV83_10800 [Desulfobacterales bacterium]